jgi:chemosensory pili system protein ChpA (sensor histidine kinase/response regulator)
MPDSFHSLASPRDVSGALLESLNGCASDWRGAWGWAPYLKSVARVETSAETSGIPAFQDICVLLQEFIRDLGERFDVPERGHHELIRRWPPLAAAFVECPQDPQKAASLIAYLQDPLWESPLSDEDASMLASFVSPVDDPLEDDSQSPSSDDGCFGAASMPDEEQLDEPAQTSAACAASEPEPVDSDSALENDFIEPQPEQAPPRTDLDHLQPAVREIVELLVGELAEMRELLAETLEIACDRNAGWEAQREALLHYGEQVQRLGMAAEVGGLVGLCQICMLLDLNLQELVDRQQALDEDARRVLSDWCLHVHTYLHDLGNEPACQTLIQLLQDPAWTTPVKDPDTAELYAALSSRMDEALMADVEPRATAATPEDVSLALPEDVDAELLDGLLQELPGQTADFSGAVQRLTFGTGDTRDLDLAQRVAHTVKGAANTVGVSGIANLTHHLEDILLALSKHQVLPGQSLSETLISAADCLEIMSESVMGQSEPPDEARDVLQSVLDWANRIDREGIEAVAGTDAETKTATTVQTPADRHADEPRVEKATEESKSAPAQMVRVPATLVDDLLRLVGETIILTGQIHERVQRTVGQARSMGNQFKLLQQLGGELEQLIDLQDISSPRQRAAGNTEFDPLELDQYNELHTVSRRLVEAATDAREISRSVDEHLIGLNDMLTDQGRLNRENQEAVLHTRMVAVQNIVPRIQRSVRQASRAAGKRIDFECVGADTMMDSNVINDLVDPLMHVLRNAVDHGIEPESQRSEAGKDPVGTIRIEFQREGNHVLVRCTDDGAGLDWARIRQVAEERGLVSEGQALTEVELCQLILRPNFSTRSTTTQLSGRGIGMDVVQTSIAHNGGSLNIESETGKGCRVEIRLPLTLVSTHALLVRATDHVLAISSRGIEQIMHPSGGEKDRVGDEPIYKVGDEIYPATTLAALLGLPADRRTAERNDLPVLIVQSETGRHAIFVDAVMDSRDLVIKSLGKYLPKLRGIAGATILGDGSVAPVMDLPELLRTPARGIAEGAHPEAAEDLAAGPALPSALVVDDSLSARRSLAQFIGDSGFRVRTARDGLEAIELINVTRPDLILVDLEMPRMNGLELTTHIRSQSSIRELPVIMVTSRSTEKHRQQAKAAGVNRYLTKPFSEDELMGYVQELCGGS